MLADFQCPGPDSNRHGGVTRRGILSPLCLPVSPPGRASILTMPVAPAILSGKTWLRTKWRKRNRLEQCDEQGKFLSHPGEDQDRVRAATPATTQGAKPRNRGAAERPCASGKPTRRAPERAP